MNKAEKRYRNRIFLNVNLEWQFFIDKEGDVHTTAKRNVCFDLKSDINRDGENHNHWLGERFYKGLRLIKDLNPPLENK